MIRKYVFLFCCLIITTNSILSQTKDKFPALNADDIPSGKITRNEIYDGNSLWGLINGGADLYLEYGFDKLLFNQIEINGSNFRVEIYKMNDPLAAFGIFSVFRYKCSRNDTLTTHICISPYQVQGAVGNNYISVINETGTDEDQITTIDLFSKIIAKIKGKPYKHPKFFSNKNFAPFIHKLKYFKGQLGLQNGFPMWIGLIENYPVYEVFLLPYENENGYAYFAQIKFGTPESAQKFVSQNSIVTEDESFYKMKSLSPNEIIFVNTNLNEEELTKLFK